VIAAFACGMAAAVVLGALAWYVTHTRVVASRLRERVIVTTKGGDSFGGVLFAHDHKALVLRETQALGAGERSTDLPLDGELIVSVADVAYIQRP
jgi:small nuclear ribonucleoprotein (snRNP)-like protein